jgi:hypothetical protein
VSVSGGANEVQGILLDYACGVRITNYYNYGTSPNSIAIHSIANAGTCDVQVLGGAIYAENTTAGSNGGPFGILIESADAWKISDLTISGANINIAIQPAAASPLAYTSNVLIDNCILEAARSGGIRISPRLGSSGIGDIRVSNSLIAGGGLTTEIFGIDDGYYGQISGAQTFGVSIVNNIIEQWYDSGIIVGPQANDSSTVIEANTINSNDSSLSATQGGIYLDGVSGALIEGNYLSTDVNGIYVYFGLVSNNITITGNDFWAQTGVDIVAPGTLTNVIIANNNGIDNIEGTVADAAFLMLPINPIFTLTGTGIPVTTINGAWPGRKFTMMPTGAPVTFVGPSATIGASFTTVQNVPVSGFVDSAGLIWLH